MAELKGINLGKRQQELNEKVIKTTSENVDFNTVKELEEQSDVDRLYKIDVASVYKNIDYILETLKCGDSLYISRALKCSWLFENENSFIINPDYLHHEVFPFMSVKMKKKLLTTVSMHIRDEKRAEDFYKYCLTDKKLNNIATKFLIWTSEQHKIEYISSNDNIDSEKVKYIIGNSFNLAETYLAKEKSKYRSTNETVHELRYLIHSSNEKYLDLMENYTDINTQFYYGQNVQKLGLRISKDVMTKHKERVSNNIPLYFKKLNLDVVAKHSSVEDVKKYAVSLLPPTAKGFWSMNFYESYLKIFKVLPQNEVYMFLREIFLAKYPNEPFEMSNYFYEVKYYKLFTNEEREMWALEHLKQNNELLGPDNDYLWYQFVNYDLAFKEIKKNIAVCIEHYNRAAMIDVLVESVKNDEELEKLLRYYYERHVNESEDYKMSFIDNIVEKINVFKLSENCWDALIKILHSTNTFSAEYSSYATSKYKTFIVVYHIIHDKSIPKILEDYVITENNAQNIKYEKETLCKNLTDEQIKVVYEKLIDLSIDKLKHFETQTYSMIKDDVRQLVDFALLIMEIFEKTKDDCPDIILKYVKLDFAYYERHKFFVNKKEEITEGTLLRLLKLDTKLLLKKLPELFDWFSRMKMRMNSLFKKIKVYFSTDVAKDWLCYCESLLEKGVYKYALFHAIIVSIFHIGNDNYKIAFVSKYVPEEAKIPHDKIDRKLLGIQEGICRYVLYSRPPIPLECILPYIKGDYVRFCIPMFNSYLNNLPMQQCIKFVSAILNTPVSIQKHGLRLAFQCFSTEDLTNLIINVWKTTKNISLRTTICKALCDKIEHADENSQRNLYGVLKMLTSDLRENDADDVFNLLTHFKVSKFKVDFLKTAWNTVNKLSEKKSKNIERKCAIVSKFESNITSVDKEFCRTQIIDEFVRSMLTEQNIGQLFQSNNMKSLIETKWNLAAKYITYIDNDQMEKSLELVQFILQRCTEMWNLNDSGDYTSRKFMFWFIEQILLYSYGKSNKTDSIPVLEFIIKILSESLPMSQIYKLYVKLNFIIISKKAIGSNEYDYGHLIPENVAHALATEVILFLKSLKIKKLLYSSFQIKISLLLCDAIKTSCYNTNLNNVEIINTLISSHLIEAVLPEAHLLALSILPRERPELLKDIWLNIIGKIQSGDNVELQTYVYEFFMHNNFKAI